MKITVVNNSNYKAETCCNGGDYGFTETYISRGDGNFELIHGTTSELPYCPLCGQFYQEECPCGMDIPDVVNREAVNKAISDAIQKVAQGENWEIVIE